MYLKPDSKYKISGSAPIHGQKHPLAQCLSQGHVFKEIELKVGLCFFIVCQWLPLGTNTHTKVAEFLEKFQGGGVISNPKIYIANFGPLNRAFLA